MSYSNWEPDVSKRAGTRSESPTLEELIASAPSGEEIYQECIFVMEMLLKKNISYGNSALQPAGIFSKADPIQQIENRIDDKLNRIKNQQQYEGDNDIDDLIGYLVLLKIARQNAEVDKEV